MAKKKNVPAEQTLNDENSFFSDMFFPDMLYGILLRSPISHGILLDIRPPKLPDGYAVYTAIDIPGINNVCIRNMKIPIFASYELSYKGEPVGILTGPDYRTVCQLAEEVQIDTETEEPFTFSGGSFSSSQILSNKNISHNFDDSIFDADEKTLKTFERTYTTDSYRPFYAEPQGAIVTTNAGRIEIYTAAQWPFQVQKSIAEMLDIPESFITVHSTNVGEHSDSKLWYPVFVSAQATLASYLEGKPVRLMYSRSEEELFAPQTPAVSIRHRTAVDMYGNIVCMDIKIIIDCGAYCPFIEELIERMILTAAGIYEIARFNIEAYAIKTNVTPKGGCFGWGDSETFFAIEAHTSYIAAASNILPAEFKLMNTINNGKKLLTGTIIKEEIPIFDLFSAVMDQSDFARKQIAFEHLAKHRAGITDGPLKGIAIAGAYQGSGFLGKIGGKESYTVEITMEKDGTVKLLMSQFSASMEKIWRQIVVSILEIEESAVSICKTNTATGTKSGPSTLSVNVTIMCRLVERCCSAIRKQRFRTALPIKVKRTYRITQNWDSTTFTGNPYSDISWAAAVVEVSVDPLRFIVSIKNIWIAIDGGKIYSPESVQRVLRKSVYESLAKTVLPVGGLYHITTNLEYCDYPDPVITLLPSKADSRGIGALALNVIPAAYTAAVSQALQTVCTSLPLTDEIIFKGLTE